MSTVRNVTTHTPPRLRSNPQYRSCISDTTAYTIGHTMAQELTKKEIYERMIELRNLRKLHKASVERINIQKELIKILKETNKNQGIQINNLETVVETLKLQIEELQTMVFGKSKKKKGDTDDDNKDELSGTAQKEPSHRSKDSYTRKPPMESEVTEVRDKDMISACPDCGDILSRKKTKVFYVEDIEIPKKAIVQYETEKGWCIPCRKWHSATFIPPTNVAIGEHTRNHIVYMSTILRLSYAQIVDDLKNRFNFNISSGEIDRILYKKAEEHRTDYERLKNRVRKEPVLHFDETGDRIRDGDGFKSHIWLMQGKETPEVVLSMGQNRGKGVAETLLGDSKAVGVTDDYGGYRNLFKEHQL